MTDVKQIIEDVKLEGDSAILRYTEFFDGIKIDAIEISRQEINAAYKKVSRQTVEAIRAAKQRIEAFAKKQLQQYKDFEVNEEGIVLGQRVVAIENVGVYVPGGNYPLPSSALMCIVPAKVAGVKNIIVCSPKAKPETIVAAYIAGADRIFRIGGVQAIAAMAYGTKTVPKVDKIVGPGNKYVTAAKKEVFGDVGIDFLAGPSEIMIIADDFADPKLVAADMLAQAEHDTDAKIFLASDSSRLIGKVLDELEKQLQKLKTREIAEQSIMKKQIIKVTKIAEAVEIANRIAPEHLELMVENPEKYTGGLNNYGSLFIGKYSAEAFGDYCAGPNHVLPTGGTARFGAGLSVRDFIKILTYQRLESKGARKLARLCATLAEAERLDGHRKSAMMRLE